MSTKTYRVYTKRKLHEDPALAKGYIKKTQKQREIDEDESLKAKFISKSECQLLDKVLDNNLPDQDGKPFKISNHSLIGHCTHTRD